jgi:hypothetical protein
MAVVFVSHSTASSSTKKTSRWLSNDISPLPKGRGTVVPSNVRPDLLQMLDAINHSNCALFHRLLHEVLQDRDDMLERLALDRQANDTSLEALYENLRKK